MSTRGTRWLALAGTGLLLAGCAVGPDYSPPNERSDPAFANADSKLFSPAAPENLWWRTLGDAMLADLIEQALHANHDLRIAQANVRAARALLRQARLDAYPAVTAQASVIRQQTSEAVTSAGIDRSETFYDAGFDAAWELDFFGRVRRSIEANSAEFEATLADQHDVAVIVAAEVARSYVDLQGAQYRLQVARSNAANQRQTYELTRVLQDAGRGTQFDVARAEAQLETTLATIEPLEAAVARNRHRIAVLVGRRPTELSDSLAAVAALPQLPATAAIGNPAELLRRRADIRAAERRLAATTARVGIATADLFPRVTLLGSAGFLATSADNVGTDASQRTSIGPFLSWAAFDLGRVRARIEAADAGVDAQLAAYEQTVLIALEETENALVDYARAQSRQARLQVAANASERAVELARTRYQHGADTFLSVLDAERRLFDAQALLAESETAMALAFVALYKALGGGWSAEGSMLQQS